jgi:hypothetical protein
MPIDNLEAAKDLSERLGASLPLLVRAGKAFQIILRDKGNRVTADTVFPVNAATYPGDAGGISLELGNPEGGPPLSEKFVVSITQLKIDPAHPLAPEVQAYQQSRIQGLKLQEQTGFAGEVLARQPSVKRATRKGFGK